MSNPLPIGVQTADCCTPCEDAVAQQVPGPAGAAGAAGTNGTDGENAFTETTAGFTVPNVGSTVIIEVLDSSWATVGQNVFIGGTAGDYEVTAKTDGTHMTVENLGYPNNAAPTTIIASGVGVSPSGQRGATGAAGAATLNAISPTTTKGDLIVDNGANNPAASDVRLAAGTDGQIFTSVAAQPTGLQWQTLLPNATSDNGIPRFDGTSGTPVALQTSGMLVADSGALQSTPTGGNGRGANSVDLQVSRSLATEVASGNSSVVAGGSNNTASGAQSKVGGGTGNISSGSQSVVSGGGSNQATGANSSIGGGTTNVASQTSTTIGGGSTNDASAQFATISGGFQNDASNSNATVGGGTTNVASGTSSVISGGSSNTASAQYSGVPSGNQAVASHWGEIAHASGMITVSGDAQRMVVIFRGTTTDATPTEIFLDGTASFFDLPNDTTWAFRALVTARRTDVDGESAAYQLLGCIDRNANAASTALVGSVGKTVIAEDTAAWDVNATAGTASGTLVITVTGENAKSISWVAIVEAVQCSG